VCQIVSLDNFSVSVGLMDHAVQASVSGIDLSVKKKTSWKTNEEPLIATKEHIQNFPAFKSHYSIYHRQQQKKYLSPDLGAQKSEESNIAYTMIMNVHTETF